MPPSLFLEKSICKGIDFDKGIDSSQLANVFPHICSNIRYFSFAGSSHLAAPSGFTLIYFPYSNQAFFVNCMLDFRSKKDCLCQIIVFLSYQIQKYIQKSVILGLKADLSSYSIETINDQLRQMTVCFYIKASQNYSLFFKL